MPRIRRAVWVGFLVCAGSPTAVAAATEADSFDCLMQPAVYRYLERVQDEILEHWTLPEDSLANREVTVRLRFEANGRLSEGRVVSQTNARLQHSVEIAILSAAPFASVPPEADCLVGLPIDTTFRNPAD